MVKHIILALVVMFFAHAAKAECVYFDGTERCGPATTYEITVEKVEFCKSQTCSSSVVVASATTAFNIASAAAGAAVGNYADLDGVEAGIYTHIKTTLSPSIRVQGSAIAGTSCSTMPNPVTASVASITGIANTLQLTQNDDFNLGLVSGKLVHQMKLDAPIAISKSGSLPQVQIDFSTADAHLCYGGNSLPGVPFVSVKVFNN